jgi:large subunit ribosomal protein L6
LTKEEKMSRIGKLPIKVPTAVKVKLTDTQIDVEGPKGKLKRTLNSEVKVAVKEDQLIVTRSNDAPKTRAVHGLMRALIANMIKGVTEGFEKKLQIVGVGYRAAVQGKKLNLTLGFSHPVEYGIPDGVTVAVNNQTELVISGVDKELVGQTAANLRFLKKPEPYLGKGVRYADEVVRRKAGKAASTGK